ncbi:helix-turn-helix domain-containing protein [Nocardia sp. NPDC058658]|uniref:helix-turn-helix domain-containing protein n=1 Tax=Nocardia sp. NPDC058658 TaxID=3346580 RepID=UPI00365B03B4
MSDAEVWLTTNEVAKRLKIPPKTLSAWASTHTGPRFAKIGRYRRYRLIDLEEWENDRLEPDER